MVYCGDYGCRPLIDRYNLPILLSLKFILENVFLKWDARAFKYMPKVASNYAQFSDVVYCKLTLNCDENRDELRLEIFIASHSSKAMIPILCKDRLVNICGPQYFLNFVIQNFLL